MKDIYGFKLLDRNGNGFKRWFNGETKLTTDNHLGRLPNTLNSINIAQDVMQFKDAYHYCFKAAIKYDLQFTLLNETNWKSIEHPVKRFFKSLVKKINFGIS